MYQNGDVDFLVATDAIGMGLNLDVHHVAFADDHKFDGHQTRPLTPAEFGQIAGRAGRHMPVMARFGVTGNARVRRGTGQALETHDFEPVEWCNGATPSWISPRSRTCAGEPRPAPKLRKA
jgi:ATP-dependent RNA helicase SUPV3L1/SUV3